MTAKTAHAVASEIEYRMEMIKGLAFLISQGFKGAIDADDHGYLSTGNVQSLLHSGLDEVELRIEQRAQEVVNLAYHGTPDDPAERSASVETRTALQTPAGGGQ
jgi:hypothetical protein